MPPSVPPCPALSKSQVANLRLSSAFPTVPPGLSLNEQLRFIASTLLGVHSQYCDAAELALWIRLPHPRPSRSDVADRIRYGSSVAGLRRMSTCRGVQHVLAISDAAILGDAVFPHLVNLRTREFARARVQLYDTFESLHSAWEAEVLRKLSYGKALTRDEWHVTEGNKRISDKVCGVQTSWAALLTTAGYAEHVSLRNSRCAAISSISTGIREMMETSEATRRCAMRYFAAYGPATELDFRYWLGMPAAPSKTAVRALLSSGEVVEVPTEEGPMLIAVSRLSEVTAAANKDVEGRSVRFLGRFEPVLLAHKEKSWVAGSCKDHVWWRPGEVGSSILVGHRLRGTWRRERSKLQVTLWHAKDEPPLSRFELSQIFVKGRELLNGFFGQRGTVTVFRQTDGFIQEAVHEDELGQPVGGVGHDYQDAGASDRPSKRRKG